MQPVHIARIIDDRPISRLQWIAVGLCMLALFADGVDQAVIGVIAPALRQQFGLTLAQMTPLFVLPQIGFFVGSLVIGPLADRFGRRTLTIFACALMGVFMLAGALPMPLDAFLFCRFMSGVGMGAVYPTVLALITEYTPRRRRAGMLMLSMLAPAFGTIAGNYASAGALATWGWHSIFVITGVGTLLLTVLVTLVLPESLQFALARKGREAQARRLLRRLVHHEADTLEVVGDPPTKASLMPLKQLFSSQLRGITLLIGGGFFLIVVLNGALYTWQSPLLADAGFSPAQIPTILSAQTVGAIFGGVLIAAIGDKADKFLCVAVAAFASGLIGAATGVAMQGFVPIIVVNLLSAFAIGVALTCSVALSALLFPTAARSSGISWTMGVGRLGGIAGPLIVGMAVAAAPEPRALFPWIVLLGIPPAVAMLILRRVPARAGADG
jgi:AAHS family 4-hydroxybenzoate transporter-like MFS transporter